jgi:hypothetical protein
LRGGSAGGRYGLLLRVSLTEERECEDANQ